MGPDAVQSNLAKLADPGGVFAPEEILAALDPWPVPPPAELPARLSEIVGGAEGSR